MWVRKLSSMISQEISWATRLRRNLRKKVNSPLQTHLKLRRLNPRPEGNLHKQKRRKKLDFLASYPGYLNASPKRILEQRLAQMRSQPCILQRMENNPKVLKKWKSTQVNSRQKFPHNQIVLQMMSLMKKLLQALSNRIKVDSIRITQRMYN